MVMVDALPSIIYDEKPGRETIFHKALDPMPDTHRLYGQVEGVPGAPPKSIHNPRWGLLFEQSERAQVHPNCGEGIFNQIKWVLTHMKIQTGRKATGLHLCRTALHAQNHLPFLPWMNSRPETPFYNGEEENIHVGFGYLKEDQLGLHLQVGPIRSNPQRRPPSLESEDAHELAVDECSNRIEDPIGGFMD